MSGWLQTWRQEVRSEKKKSTFILVVDVVATIEDLEQIL